MSVMPGAETTAKARDSAAGVRGSPTTLNPDPAAGTAAGVPGALRLSPARVTKALFAAIAFFAIIARAKTPERDRWYWIALAVLFVWLSMDEAAMIHEMVQNVLRRGADRQGTFYGLAAITLPATLALTVLVATIPFLISLPRRTAGLFLGAGALFVAGAIGVDYVGELHKNAYGENNVTFALMNGLEETLEMSGVAIFVYALLDYARMHDVRVTLAVQTPRKAVVRPSREQ